MLGLALVEASVSNDKASNFPSPLFHSIVTHHSTVKAASNLIGVVLNTQVCITKQPKLKPFTFAICKFVTSATLIYTSMYYMNAFENDKSLLVLAFRTHIITTRNLA